MTSLRPPFAAALVFLIFAGIYAAAVVKLDNTNIGTTNGLWKTPGIRGWEKGTGKSLDSGEWLYTPLYGHLCRLIPDRWVSYGTPGPIVTFRKMALLNSLLGGLASSVVFLLAMRFLGSSLTSLFASFIATLAHACAAFVIVNSVNSEDIIPAYTFFLLTTYFLFSYLQTNRLVYFLASIFCCTILTLLHWTLMIPTLAGVITVGFLVVIKPFVNNDRRRFWMLPVFLAGFLILLEIFLLGFGHIDSIKQILYPAKAAPDGYIGFRWTKVVFAFIGIGNYFLNGRNFSDYRPALADTGILEAMSISWCFTAVALAALVWASIRRSSPPVLRLLAIFGLAVFSVGQLEHLYSQPQDPQSQLQPMFATIIGVIVILEVAVRVSKPYVKYSLILVMGGIFTMEGVFNVRAIMPTNGDDSRYMKAANELARAFPPDRAVLVTHGWEEWNTWVFAETFAGDSARYRARNIGLVNGFIAHPGILPADAADLMAKEISDAIDKGSLVVANVVWVGSKDDFAFGLTNLVDVGQARIYTDRLQAAFRVGRSWDTPVGKFVELLK
jgi:hypothetical protein